MVSVCVSVLPDRAAVVYELWEPGRGAEWLSTPTDRPADIRHQLELQWD